jgi:hypothetical protein
MRDSSIDLLAIACRNFRELSADIQATDLIQTPTLILRRLIATLLTSFPQITISHISTLTLSRFHELQSSSSNFRTWDLLVEILEIVQDVMVENRQELYIIIDRLDKCVSDDESFGVRKHLIPRLQEIPQRWRNTRVVVTSTVMAERVGTLRLEEGWLRNVWIDTASAVSMDDPDVYDE